MGSVREQLTNMFSKIMAGTVTREEGTMLINSLVRANQADTVKELSYLIENPPPSVFPKTILHTISLSRNKALHNIIIAALEHKNEDVSIFAAQELASQKTLDAKNVLIEHLSSEAYHVRKASALALCKGFSDGIDLVREHVMTQAEPFYRSTSAQALLASGKSGMEALLKLLGSGNSGAMTASAEVLINAARDVDSAQLPQIFEALMIAGDKKDSAAIIELLQVCAALDGRAKGFEGYVMAFTDYPFEPVRKAAQTALKRIKG